MKLDVLAKSPHPMVFWQLVDQFEWPSWLWITLLKQTTLLTVNGVYFIWRNGCYLRRYVECRGPDWRFSVGGRMRQFTPIVMWSLATRIALGGDSSVKIVADFQTLWYNHWWIVLKNEKFMTRCSDPRRQTASNVTVTHDIVSRLFSLTKRCVEFGSTYLPIWRSGTPHLGNGTVRIRCSTVLG